ncbi:unnamed protein product [Orchesella dallaii]|uniref:Uncharacterized protein n=1 Tax=Orchesella dallaii TaxID=48710 RepID=A0ABP1PVF4_9HEXA
MSQYSASGADGVGPLGKNYTKKGMESTVARRAENRMLHTSFGGVKEHANVHKLEEQVVKNLTKYVDNDMFNRMKEEINKLNQSGQLETISNDAPTLTCMLRELFELGNHGLQ